MGELSLLGAMGCGTWLVKTLLAELEEGELAGEYDVVVLQATDTSLPFYEKMGFTRVGAVARYARPGATNGPEAVKARKEQAAAAAAASSSSSSSSSFASPTPSAAAAATSSSGYDGSGAGGLPSPLNDPIASRIVGYRHWTFSDEPLRSDVEVSKMMVRRVNHAKPRGAAATALAAKAKAAADKAAKEAMSKSKSRIAKAKKKKQKMGVEDDEESDGLTPAARNAAKNARKAILNKPPTIKALAKATAARAQSVPLLEGQIESLESKLVAVPPPIVPMAPPSGKGGGGSSGGNRRGSGGGGGGGGNCGSSSEGAAAGTLASPSGMDGNLDPNGNDANGAFPLPFPCPSASCNRTFATYSSM